MARRGRFRRALSRARAAAAPRVRTVTRFVSAGARRGASKVRGQFGTKRQEGGRLLSAAVETATGWGAGALRGGAEGLMTTENEMKALPWVARGLALGLTFVSERYGGAGGRLVRAAASGLAGADGAQSVKRRADKVAKK